VQLNPITKPIKIDLECVVSELQNLVNEGGFSSFIDGFRTSTDQFGFHIIFSWKPSHLIQLPSDYKNYRTSSGNFVSTKREFVALREQIRDSIKPRMQKLFIHHHVFFSDSPVSFEVAVQPS